MSRTVARSSSGSDDPRRLLEGLTTDLLLDPDLEPVLCGSAPAPSGDDLLDLPESCEWFFVPGFAIEGRYSEGGDLSFDGLTHDGSESP